MSQPVCPFCFEKHGSLKSRLCPKVKRKDDPDKDEEIPERYIAQYDQVPPLWLLTVGFSKHGKTCYIAALTLMLENLYRIWPRATWFPLDSYTTNVIQDTRRQAFERKVPEHTENLRPIFIDMYGVPEFQDNCLVIYDAPGEIYEDVRSLESGNFSIQPLKKVTNIWFLVSLYELATHPEKKINDLLNTYITGMQNLKLSMDGRNLIVVYTMADKLMSGLSYRLPTEIPQYITNDPFKDITNNAGPVDVPSIMAYIEEMKSISDLLEKYTIEQVPGGGAFVELARRSGMGLYFCINSALGSDLEDGKVPSDIARSRILDPYLWALFLNIQEKPLSIKLVLDGSETSDPVYNKIGLTDLFDKLNGLGEVTTYVLGEKRQVSIVGQAPPTEQPSIPRARLLGPILESLENESVMIVITAGEVKDLMDFASPDWTPRILLVTLGKEAVQAWPNQVVIRDGDSADIIIDEFRRLFVVRK